VWLIQNLIGHKEEAALGCELPLSDGGRLSLTKGHDAGQRRASSHFLPKAAAHTATGNKSE